MDLSSYVNRYENELVDNVIPFWETHCVDREYGGYFTSLDRDGSTRKNTCGCNGASSTCSQHFT